MAADQHHSERRSPPDIPQRAHPGNLPGPTQRCGQPRGKARRRDIARGICFGESVGELARKLGVGHQAVRRHLCRLYEETDARSQAGLVGWCVAHGVVTLAELQEVYGSGEMEGWSEW